MVATGPVRTLLRCTSRRVFPTSRASEGGRTMVPARVVHESHFYHDLPFCFVKSSIANIGKGTTPLVVARGRVSFRVTPKGRESGNTYWVCSARPWKTWTASTKGGLLLKQALGGLVNGIRPAEGWRYAYTSGPGDSHSANLGIVLSPRGTRFRLRAGRQKEKFMLELALHRPWLRVPPKGRL